MVHELLDAAAAEAGGAARVAPFRMRLAAHLKDDAELEKWYGVLTKDPNDAQAARAAGLALYERAQTLTSRAPLAAPTCRRAASPCSISR